MNTLRIVASGAGGGSGASRASSPASFAGNVGGIADSVAARSSASPSRIQAAARRVQSGKGLTSKMKQQGFRVTRPQGRGGNRLLVAPPARGGGGRATGRQITVGP